MNDEFIPCATYFSAMDELICLTEDCSYRSDVADLYLDILYHPHEERIVGVKLKEAKFLLTAARRIVANIQQNPYTIFVSVAIVLEVARIAVISSTLKSTGETYNKLIPPDVRKILISPATFMLLK